MDIERYTLKLQDFMLDEWMFHGNLLNDGYRDVRPSYIAIVVTSAATPVLYRVIRFGEFNENEEAINKIITQYVNLDAPNKNRTCARVRGFPTELNRPYNWKCGRYKGFVMPFNYRGPVPLQHMAGLYFDYTHHMG